MDSNEFCLPNMSDSDPDQLFICPFDKVHRISAKRFPYHIMKCRKNHRAAKVHFCPFNARHIVPLSEIRHHVANCPDRSTIEPDLAYAEAQKDTDGTYMKGDTSVPTYHHDSHPTSSENWDLEDARQRETIDEQAQPERIHTLVGLTKSQRKEFNRKLLEVHKSNSKETDSLDNSEDEEEALQLGQEEVRLPKQLPRAGGPDQRQQIPYKGILNSVGQSVPRGPVGLGRATLIPRQVTAVQGRSIAANIFNTQTTQQQSTAETSAYRQTPTMDLASANTVTPSPSAQPQSEFCNTPPAGLVSNMAGLGRGLGLPRGGYRPGLGMPAVGLQAGIQTGSYPGVKQS